MFSSTILRQTMRMAPIRKFSNYTPKSWAKIWLGDAGAYPVMSIMGLVLVLGSYATYTISSHTEDLRVTKSARKSLFRGELQGLDISETH